MVRLSHCARFCAILNSMSAIICEHVAKKYGQTVIIPDLSMHIHSGEFFTILGPSGCGKTTLLRMIAGFTAIERGTIAFDGNVINALPPEKRNIGMVFQNYALFPNMTVEQNVAFGLVSRNMDKAEIAARVQKIIELVHIDDCKNRKSDELSGGQQQRAALARAIVIEPDVLLMDEPLSNLDAKLRVDMRNTIKRIQKMLGITTLYVTHDQEEALAVSDRIAVMRGGIIEQIGTAREIYEKPATIDAATFIGKTSILDATLVDSDNGGGESGGLLDFGGGYTERVHSAVKRSVPVKVSVRPEAFYFAPDTGGGLRGKIIDSVFLGARTHYFVRLEREQVIEVEDAADSTDEKSIGKPVVVKVHPEKITVFEARPN
ncbi:MAG: ABC transporter ATP-binding protein [Treponemataceae bacterium]|nr:MAG: ABC transporter ATP-binding protein [Treponemataceae bacterium]